VSQSCVAAKCGKLVVDLIIKRDSVALHMLPELERVRAANRLIELPFNAVLGTRDPNFRLLFAMLRAAELELKRRR
jgi:hypothetical protein